ncbi:uncharacterized protein LOC126911875 [Spodoptera frugiperda]|uniref:Uncharacterized protein LOC126911875 n=1 Tax=Spodoptera frugiperda TaxID=7108 RepID=A0A9R0F1J1_SPOFR|nr:uncharacterized protein LOC126911875 [Spodoptera frugiperda]
MARKFVSESISDKIADFIARATEKMMRTLEAQDNNQPILQDISDHVSEENDKYNIEKRGLDIEETRMQDKIKSAEDILGKEKEKSSSIETNRDTEKTKDEPLSIGNPYEVQSRYIADTQTDTATNRELEEVDDKKTNGEERERYDDKIQYTFHTLGTTECTKSNKKPKQDSNMVISHVASIEDNTVAEDLRHKTTPDEFPENETFQKRAFEIDMTTSKNGEEEFDQYDNKRVSLIATSGPMSLLIPRRSNKQENWWEKELPKPDTPRIRKR